MSDPVIALVRSVAFLSRLPVPDRFFTDDPGRTGEYAGIFPLAGAVIALPSAMLILIFAALGAPDALTALLALALMIVLTGALHEDGLADCADAFGAAGHKLSEPGRILAILKDSQIGVYGALSLILSVALRAVCLAALIAAASPLLSALVFLVTAALSRGLMVAHWYHLSSARSDGVAGRAGAPDAQARSTALIGGIIPALLITFWLSGIIALLLVVPLAIAATYAWTRYVERHLGGHTGDTIGATQQIAETAFLIALVVAL
ncbi:adenosylcobinamide-GDP ribazoletransferase [Pseudohoeflea coraliihabitans]|uniref:Adenosylcobinamide-GDP ribazoletransferase n=1 Tax=Pseudohoeflea coraliihabitans TaxID=2860393 RepID=A0ABS6WRE6_9HYPH|nr:adenosylcobinamide-GDP ribazoletransferase [Pseudohoeflea sp. DP4N28-3]MBW3097992.1 adenosylcobinamide-GDP ribazoletransferase [Pseudohoeflea sp. DP4N28-3]